MQKITYYKCSYCHNQYETEAECQICENSHLIEPQVIGQKYLSYKACRNGAPTEITVEFENGAKYTYYR